MRTDPTKVRATLECSADLDVTNQIRTAGVITDRIETKDTDNLLSASDLVEIETYVAAHLVSLKDAQYRSKSTEGASATFLERDWLAIAKMIDVTGTLAAMENNLQDITVEWLGLPQSSRTEWQDWN